MTLKRKRPRNAQRKNGEKKKTVTNLAPSHLRPRAEAKSIAINVGGVSKTFQKLTGTPDSLDKLMLSYGNKSSDEVDLSAQSAIERARERSEAAKKVRVEAVPRIWDPLCKSTKTVQEIYFQKAKSEQFTTCTLEREAARRKCIRQLQGKLERLCISMLGESICQKLQLHTQVTLRNGNATFERWLFNSLIGNDVAGIDPLLPHRECLNGAGEILRKEVEQAGAEEDVATKVVAQFSKFANKLVRNFSANLEKASLKVQKRRGKQIEDVVSMSIPEVIADHDNTKNQEKVRVTLAWSKDDSVDQDINFGHLEKLAELYARHNGIPVDDRKGLMKGENQEFSRAVMTMLLRYDTFGGPGFQAALNKDTFNVLKKRFGVRHECFASPFNCRFEHFNSAFVDSDYLFGSCGSFFDFHPTRGSYEANPPFVPKVIARMTSHIDELLGNSSLPLSFVVIVPDWSEHSGKANMALIKSPFLKHHLKVANREHSYHEGAQHRKSRTYRKSTCDTAVYFLQNQAGNDQWTPTLETCEELVNSFSS